MPAQWKTDTASGDSKPPACESGSSARILIAGVGYRNLRDISLGPLLTERLGKEDWPSGVEIEDLSYGPIGVMHNLDDRPAYDRIIFVAGVSRNRKPGEIYCYRWKHELPDPEEIQARIAEAVTGVISLDNLLIISTYFKKLPADVVVIEVEPVDDGWGEAFTSQVAQAVPMIIEQIRRQVGAS